MKEKIAPQMSNIPLWNLREEFHYTSELIGHPSFEDALKPRHRAPVRTPLFDWRGNREDLLSLLVQRAIQGAESYTSASAWKTLGRLGRLTKELNEQVRNPFRIQRGAGAVAAYYHHLPALIHADLSIQAVDPDFWIELKQFYRDVRNPLFHGSHFATADVSNVRDAFRIISEIYAWTDQWQEPEYEPGKRMIIQFGLKKDET